MLLYKFMKKVMHIILSWFMQPWFQTWKKIIRGQEQKLFMAAELLGGGRFGLGGVSAPAPSRKSQGPQSDKSQGGFSDHHHTPSSSSRRHTNNLFQLQSCYLVNQYGFASRFLDISFVKKLVFGKNNTGII